MSRHSESRRSYRCPYCGGRSDVTRTTGGKTVVRQRSCFVCGRRFSTREILLGGPSDTPVCITAQSLAEVLQIIVQDAMRAFLPDGNGDTVQSDTPEPPPHDRPAEPRPA